MIRGLTCVAAILLLAPTIIVAIASLGPGETITFPPGGITLSWYGDLFQSREIRASLVNSLYVTFVGVLIGVVIGIPAALGLYKYAVKPRAVVGSVLFLGFTTPVVASALSFLILFNRLHVIEHLTAVGVAVAIVNLPVMLWAVGSSLAGLNPEVDDAAATLGADDVQRFLFVTLPGIGPGIFVGILLLVVFGMTDFIVSLLLVSSANTTLPVYLFGGLRTTTSPLLAAVASVYVVGAAVVFAVVMKIGRIEEAIHRR